MAVLASIGGVAGLSQLLGGAGAAMSGAGAVGGLIGRRRRRREESRRYRQQMRREDNAVRRRVYDLQQAGLSPSLAISGGASMGAAGGNTSVPPPVEGPGEALQGVGESMAGVAQTLADTQRIQAEGDRIEKMTPHQVEGQKVNNEINKIRLSTEEALRRGQIDVQRQQSKLNAARAGKVHYEIGEALARTELSWSRMNESMRRAAVLDMTWKIMERNLEISHESGQPVGTGTSGPLGLILGLGRQTPQDGSFFKEIIKKMLSEGDISEGQAKEWQEAIDAWSQSQLNKPPRRD